MSNHEQEVHEVKIFTFGTDAEDVPDLHDIIARFDEVYKSRGCPQGDAYDSQFDMMLLETAMHFSLIYHDLGNGNIVFSPPSYDTEYVLSYMNDHIEY